MTNIALLGIFFKYFLYVYGHVHIIYDDVICNIAIYAHNATLFSNQVSDLWQKLELASELESDIWDAMHWGRKWLVDFNAEKTPLVLFNHSNNTGAIGMGTMDWWIGLLRKDIF